MDPRHFFKSNIELDQLEKVKPRAGELSHAEMVHNLISVCDLLKWRRDSTKRVTIGATRDRQAAVIGLCVTPSGARPLEDEWDYVVGLALFTNGQKLRRLYHGVSPPGGCGVPLGCCYLRKKGNSHGRYPVLPQLVDVLEQFAKETNEYHRRLYLLQGWRMSRTECEKVLLHASRKGLMPWSRIGKIDRLLGDDKEVSFWSIIQAFAKISRMNHPMTKQPEQVWQFVRTVEKLGVPT